MQGSGPRVQGSGFGAGRNKKAVGQQAVLEQVIEQEYESSAGEKNNS